MMCTPQPLALRSLCTWLLGLALALPAGCSRTQPPSREASNTPSSLPPGTMGARTAGPSRASTSGAYTEAAWQRKEAEVRKQLGSGFTLVRAHPFLVAGDEPAARVRRHAEDTVRWATRHLKKLYFTKDPPQILTIYLFKDARSYGHHTRKLWGHAPSTPFGYYSDTEGALVMNIATGGGTLVHEMVHPFMSANFPEAPSWLNEGLGSLYEQCGERDGRITGFTNWRLAGLQRAIRARRVPSFKTLVHTTTRQFYDQDPGTNYAQARYLMYYLQQQGKLVQFYRAFHKAARAKGAARDATGEKTLLRTLGITVAQLPAFQRRWEAWVLTLRFP